MEKVISTRPISHTTYAPFLVQRDLSDSRQNVCRHSVSRRITTSPLKQW